MIICPWCGTNYLEFQSNCKNCCGPIPAPREEAIFSSSQSELAAPPPPAPRPISNAYAWRLLTADGWALAVLILGLLGFIFTLVGAGLILGIVTAIVGIPFLAIGIIFLCLAIAGLVWRYGRAWKVLNILRMGEVTSGQIVEVQENYSVRVNGRHPWVIGFQFRVNGQDYNGNITTLNPVGQDIQPGKSAWVLFLPEDPRWNSIYPHP
ncbi:MAG: hypothetical protein AB9891_06705 [Anaerolineaceae bacterium]